MQELAKAMFGASLGMGLFAARQASRLASPDGVNLVMRDSETFFNHVGAYCGQALGPEGGKIFSYVDEIQRRVVDGAGSQFGDNPLDPSMWLALGRQATEQMFSLLPKS